ncbi:uncharacterized protein C19orf47-like isoform X2 [Liolophura sinensis]|uniref:uncharacterized protein C19orf47-like isoform X2 n=1 Tax=Liolophura sinensis TaxID=3198878 RepID=UPI003158B490
MESSDMSTTSYWIKFFKTAGVPVGDAANYAVAFADNRIQKEMLMDLTKEYLNDMGITRLGDVIAILKHAKSVHVQDAREKILHESRSSPLSHGILAVSSVREAAKASPTSSPTPGRKGRSTAASRIVDHYIGNDPQAAPMNQPSPPTVVKKASIGVIRLNPARQQEVPVPKVRRVFPEHEGKYKIFMPAGTTAKTKKILEQQKRLSISETRLGVKSSVFERLGQDSGTGDGISGLVKVTGLDKDVSSVFRRLGGKTTIKRAATSTSQDLLDDDDDTLCQNDPPLQYAGVLKASPKKTKTAVQTETTKFKVTLKNPLQDRLGKVVVSDKCDGSLASDTVTSGSKSVKHRLGGVVSAPASSTTSGMVSSSKSVSVIKVNKTTLNTRPFPGKGKAVSLKSGGVKARLGGHSEVSSSQEISSTAGKKTSLAGKEAKSKGVFGRLGQQV